MTTVSPFYHYNSGDYASNPNDTPVVTTEDRASTYAGGQATFAANYKKNDLQVGFLSFYQSDNQFFGAIFNDGSGNSPIADPEQPTANLETFYIDDKFKPFSWLTLSAGMRPTWFSEGNFGADSVAPISESAISPRFGAAVTVPKLNWTFRAFYGHYYQAPPIETVSGPALINYVQGQQLGFIPLPGERDEEHQFGVTIPYRGWVLDADNFQTNVANFLDHNNIGASNIFFPITVSQALIRGWELTLRSPRIAHRAQVHLAYSNQIAEGSGTITGGLTDFTLAPGLSPLDHDQRNTLNVGGDVNLPWRSYASINIYYGSGFSNGENRLRHSPQRREPPRDLRRQPHLRRISLEPAARDLCASALAVPLLIATKQTEQSTEQLRRNDATSKIPIHTHIGHAVANRIHRLQSHQEVSTARRSGRQEPRNWRNYGESWRHSRIHAGHGNALPRQRSCGCSGSSTRR
jgi:hypothetical protein